jgi:hypothetical protein
MNTESKTPRTDALEERWNRTLVPLTQEGIDLCRELELERDEAKKALTHWQYNHDAEYRARREVEAERDQLKRERDEAYLKPMVDDVATETCADCKKSWSPSLIESGTCIFCILTERKRERDKARAALLSCSS